MGVCDEKTADVVAQALVELGHQRAVVVTGAGGWDEFVLEGSNRLLEINKGAVVERIMPAPRPDLSGVELPGGDASENSLIFKELLCWPASCPLADLLYSRPVPSSIPGTVDP